MTNKTTLKRLKLDPYFSKTIETNLNVWSHDQNSYEIKFEFYDHQCDKPIDLTGADMRILLDHADSKPKIYPLEIESKVLGLAKFIMPKEIRGCEGKFTAHIYADYPNRTHDFGSFTFHTKLSRLDGDLGGCMDEIYVSEFEKALEDIKEFKVDIDKNINDMKEHFDDEYNKTKEEIEQIEKLINEKKVVTKPEFELSNEKLVNMNKETESRIADLEDDIFNNKKKLTYKMSSVTVTDKYIPLSEYEFKHLNQQGASATLVVMVGVENETDSSPKTLSTERIIESIDNANKENVKIDMLKPHIGIGFSDNFYRGNYDPDNKELFFFNWTNIMNSYANLCSEYDIPILCISTEMNKLTTDDYVESWSKMIKEIKSNHPELKITMAMNLLGDKNSTKVLEHLDYLGLNAYPVYTYKKYNEEEITVDELYRSVFLNPRDERFNYMDIIDTLSAKYDKKVIVTETGVMPKNEGLIRSVVQNPEDENTYEVISLAMKAMFNTVCMNPNVVGISWWHAGRSPFNYFKHDETTDSEKTITKYYKEVF